MIDLKSKLDELSDQKYKDCPYIQKYSLKTTFFMGCKQTDFLGSKEKFVYLLIDLESYYTDAG